MLGAEPSGAAVALEHALAGRSVTLLGQGDRVPAEPFDGARPVWELTRLAN